MKRRTRGITLAELLVTASILGFVAPGILLASGTAARMGRSAQKRAVALALVNRQIEDFRGMARRNLVITVPVNVTVSSTGVGSFAVTRTIEMNNAMGTCEVAVSWTDTRGRNTFTETLRMGTMRRLRAD